MVMIKNFVLSFVRLLPVQQATGQLVEATLLSESSSDPSSHPNTSTHLHSDADATTQHDGQPLEVLINREHVLRVLQWHALGRQQQTLAVRVAAAREQVLHKLSLRQQGRVSTRDLIDSSLAAAGSRACLQQALKDVHTLQASIAQRQATAHATSAALASLESFQGQVEAKEAELRAMIQQLSSSRHVLTDQRHTARAVLQTALQASREQLDTHVERLSTNYPPLPSLQSSGLIKDPTVSWASVGLLDALHQSGYSRESTRLPPAQELLTAVARRQKQFQAQRAMLDGHIQRGLQGLTE
jgi:hypothetical protein